MSYRTSYDSMSSYNRKQRITLGGLLCWCLCVIPFVGWVVADSVAGIRFEIAVEGYLKRAADSNTIEIAEKELDKAINNIESKGWTRGSTHVLWETPVTDVQFWYNNLKTSREELKRLSPEATSLEKSNMLIKLRETLLDHGEKGDYVTTPLGISLHPNNTMYFMWIIGSIFIIAISIIVIIFKYKWN